MSRSTTVGVRSSPEMDQLLQRLTEVSIRQQQIVEHLATRQGETEQELAALQADAASQRALLPDPRAQATRLLPKLTPHDDVEAFLQMFESTAVVELARLARHWLLEGDPTAELVAERVVIERLLRALPRSHRQAVSMRNPTGLQELIEAVELADATQQRDAGEVVQERRAPEGASRLFSRPAAPTPRDEPMPTEVPAPPTKNWLAGCIVHSDLPSGAPEVKVNINGKPYLRSAWYSPIFCPQEATRKPFYPLPVCTARRDKYPSDESPFRPLQVPG
ncbi:hypothetical protein M9458_026230, partial [Cirrhinus mrigala]